jgi:hypothetical protein
MARRWLFCDVPHAASSRASCSRGSAEHSPPHDVVDARQEAENNDVNTAREETRALLARADQLRMKRREVAELLKVSVQRVSDYYKILKDGTGDAMPVNSRKVLQLELEKREAGRGTPLAYPSERGAHAHVLLERLGTDTNFSGAVEQGRWADRAGPPARGRPVTHGGGRVIGEPARLGSTSTAVHARSARA